MRFSLSVFACPHHGNHCLVLDDGKCSVRLTGMKCCGTWTPMIEWPLTYDQMRLIAVELEKALLFAPDPRIG